MGFGLEDSVVEGAALEDIVVVVVVIVVVGVGVETDEIKLELDGNDVDEEG